VIGQGERMLRHVIILLVIALGITSGGAHAADAVEGKWYGTAGFPQDRVPWGFEIKPDPTGTALKAYLYSPIINFYGLEIPGAISREGDKYTNKDWHISFALKGDRLIGTIFFNDVPFTLARTDHLPSETPLPAFDRGPGPKWQQKLGAAIYATAAVADGTAYVGTTGGMFYAINIKDGSYRWAFAAGRPIYGEASVTTDAVYFTCDNGFLYKLDRATSKEVWHYDLGDGQAPRILPHQVVDNSGDFDFDIHASRPTRFGDTIYVGSGDGSIHAVNARSGARVWRFAAKGKMRGDVVVDRTRLYVGGFGGVVYAIDRNTGAQIWEKDTKAEITDSVALIGDVIVVGNRGGLLAGLNRETGQTIWKAQLWGSSAESTAIPAKVRGQFYFGSSDLRRVALMDAKDGRVLWRTDVYGWAWPRPTLAGNRLYMSAIGAAPYQMRHLGSLTAMDAESGKIIWRWPMPESPGAWMNGFVASPVVSDGAIIVGGLDGSLYAFPAS